MKNGHKRKLRHLKRVCSLWLAESNIKERNFSKNTLKSEGASICQTMDVPSSITRLLNGWKEVVTRITKMIFSVITYLTFILLFNTRSVSALRLLFCFHQFLRDSETLLGYLLQILSDIFSFLFSSIVLSLYRAIEIRWFIFHSPHAIHWLLTSIPQKEEKQETILIRNKLMCINYKKRDTKQSSTCLEWVCVNYKWNAVQFAYLTISFWVFGPGTTDITVIY